MNSFVTGSVDINHDLKLTSIETVDVDGSPSEISYENEYKRREERLKYSYIPKQFIQVIFFKTFAIYRYSKISEVNK